MMLSLRRFVPAVTLAAAALSCVAAHAQSKCSDAAINRSFTTVILRPAVGSGTSGECNPALYGVHKDQHSLDLAVVAYTNAHPAPRPAAPVAQPAVYIDMSRQVLMDHGTAIPLSQVDLVNPSGSIIAPGSVASLVAQGGGNLVAQGGGNLVAQGGGNYHVQSVGAKKKYVFSPK